MQYQTFNSFKEQEKAARKLARASKSYNQYMGSRKWKATKRRLIGGQRCRVCGSRNIHGHHTNYNSVGKEKLGDVVALCGVCHKAFHKEHGAKRNMVAETQLFIKEQSRLVRIARDQEKELQSYAHWG